MQEITVERLPERLDLPATGTIHIWRVELDQHDGAVQALRELLNSEERARADRFFRPIHGRRFTVGRAFLRMLLGAYLAREPADIQFAYGPQGKPIIEAAPLAFNLSHSGDAALCAVGLVEAIGIDIEAERDSRDLAPIARRYFSPPEQAEFFGLPEAERRAAFYRCWTSKEALLKAWGTGLATPLHRFTVRLGEEAGLLAMDVPGLPHTGWRLRPVPAPAGYRATVAYRGEIGEFQLFRCARLGCSEG